MPMITKIRLHALVLSADCAWLSNQDGVWVLPVLLLPNHTQKMFENLKKRLLRPRSQRPCDLPSLMVCQRASTGILLLLQGFFPPNSSGASSTIVACFAMQIISIIFRGKMITAWFGKLYVIEPVFSIDCGGLGAPFLTHFLLYVKRSLKVWPCLGLAQAGGACENGP